MTNYRQVKPLADKQILLSVTGALLLAIIIAAISISACDNTESDKPIEFDTVSVAEKGSTESTATKIETVKEIKETEQEKESATTSPTEEIKEELTLPAEDVEAIAKTLYGECRGVESDMEKAAVAWCILNRVDSRLYPNTVVGVVTQPKQFAGYDDNYPVTESLKEIATDVLTRWYREKDGEENVGRVLPKEYIFFVGDGEHNYFTKDFLGKNYYDWSLANPYED